MKGDDKNTTESVDQRFKKLDELKPDFPATPGDVFYSPDTVLPFIPVPPEPYETWTEEMGY